MKPILFKKDIIAALGLLFTIGILFSPLIKVFSVQADQSNIIIYGLSTIGQTENIPNLATHKSFQLGLVFFILMAWTALFLSSQKMQYRILVVTTLVLTVFPTWLMTYVEGPLKAALGGQIDLQFSYGMLFLALSLICSTMGIVNMHDQKFNWKKNSGRFTPSTILDN
ncbi:MAG: hypothetical protein AAFO07_13020 [Bacteroidota bacterium]